VLDRHFDARALENRFCTIVGGGPSRGFSQIKPSYSGALSSQQIEELL
jgi:hypothetical protein